MKRRTKAGGKGTKRPDRKTGKRKQRGLRESALRRASSGSGKTPDIQRLIRERDEALEQQAATSEVLQAISSFSNDLQFVFATMLEKAVRICDAKFGTLLAGHTF
jgi:hypothetical protein